MTTAAIAGKLAVVQIATEIPPTPAVTWTSLVEVYEIGELPIERDTYDVTSHSASYYREYIMGLFVTSTLVLSANYVKAQYDTLFALVGANAERHYRLLYPSPDDSTHEFIGLTSNVSPATPLDDRITYTITLTITGAISRGTL